MKRTGTVCDNIKSKRTVRSYYYHNLINTSLLTKGQYFLKPMIAAYNDLSKVSEEVKTNGLVD